MEKEEIKKNINNTINSMKNEYDLFVDNLKNGKFESYEDLLTKTKNKIEEHKKNLENKITKEIPKFRENLLKELPTIKNVYQIHFIIMTKQKDVLKSQIVNQVNISMNKLKNVNQKKNVN